MQTNDNMNWQTAKDYRSPLAEEVADLASIRHDLEFVIRTTGLALLIPEPVSGADGATGEDDLIRRTSLWSAAVIAYARCFGTGVRQVRLTEDWFSSLGDKTAQALIAHRYCIDTRNKHVAHSVNSFERVKVALLVGDGVRLDKVVGCGPFLIRVAAEAPANIQNLQNLATVLIHKVEHALQEQHLKLLAEAKALDDQALDALADLGFPVPVRPEDASKPRTR